MIRGNIKRFLDISDICQGTGQHSFEDPENHFCHIPIL